MKALGQIERWKKTALALSAVGVAFLYAGIGGQKENIFFSILGISLLFAGVGSAAVLNLGLRNGKRNVELAAEKGFPGRDRFFLGAAEISWRQMSYVI